MRRRKAYLVSKSLRQYLLASVITMAVANLNLMTDSILMGNFLGPDALAAINLCLPVINLITALGQMDKRRATAVSSLSPRIRRSCLPRRARASTTSTPCRSRSATGGSWKASDSITIFSKRMKNCLREKTE